jgi:hypothetical protein
MIGITSFSPKGYEVYGKKFLESAVECWPGDLHVYVDEIPDYRHDKITYKLLSELSNLQAFLAYCDRNPVFCGNTAYGYEFKRDARRFSFKVFAQLDVLNHYSGKIFWLDADMVFKKPVPLEFLVDTLDGKTVCLLIREGLHAETGFVGFDTNGIGFDHFLDTYTDIYRRGKIFKEPYWIDGHAMQIAVKESGVPHNNLSSFFRIPNDRKMTMDDLDVMSKTILGEYLIHNKGKKKFAA